MVVGGERSSTLSDISGMLQGSVHGPLLFLIFIDETSDQISPGSSYNISLCLRMTLLFIHRPIHSVLDYYMLQNNVTAIVSWIINFLHSLQPAKCCYMVISRKRSPPPIIVHDTPLSLVDSVKYLGMDPDIKLILTCLGLLMWPTFVTK